MTETTWKNWSGTQSCHPAEYVEAGTVEQVQEVVSRATEQGTTVRAVGTGHSFTPVVSTDGIVLDISGISGLESADPVGQRARIRAGSTIASVGELLWEEGLSLRNQGDIDFQTFAGAISTATHGSGLKFTSLSGAVSRAELVTADGELHVIEGSDPLLHAVQTSVGSLGILTSVELEMMPAYKLLRDVSFAPLPEVLERWPEETRARRHFMFWWGPYEGSLELYGIPSPPSDLQDPCYVRTYDQVPADYVDDSLSEAQLGPAHRIFAGNYPPGWDELEYFVPYEVALEALQAIRPVLDAFPDQQYPVEVRTIAAEPALMSPMHGRESVSISLSGAIGTDYWDFLRGIDLALRDFDARPHWGKTHFFDAARLREVHPRYDEFVAIRRELDPTGTFLNEHLRDMFA
jgi:FAD/FMN-containing dehydrogenase